MDDAFFFLSLLQCHSVSVCATECESEGKCREGRTENGEGGFLSMSNQRTWE